MMSRVNVNRGVGEYSSVGMSWGGSRPGVFIFGYPLLFITNNTIVYQCILSQSKYSIEEMKI